MLTAIEIFDRGSKIQGSKMYELVLFKQHFRSTILKFVLFFFF